LNFIINVVGTSCKQHDELQAAQAAQIAQLRATSELDTRKWHNQIGSLKRAGDSHWSSHFHFICSLIRMFDDTCSVLENIRREWATYSQRGDANATYKWLNPSNSYLFYI